MAGSIRFIVTYLREDDSLVAQSAVTNPEGTLTPPGGLAVWGRTAIKMRRGYEPARLYLSLELCAVYWPYLLAIWLVLFGLLVLT